MEDIYDRSEWPSPEANPLVQLVMRGDEWYSNKEINSALDVGREGSKAGAPMANLKQVIRVIGETETVIESRSFGAIQSSRAAFKDGGTARYYSRKALVLLAMRANTINAAAFRDWLAGEFAAAIAQHGERADG